MFGSTLSSLLVPFMESLTSSIESCGPLVSCTNVSHRSVIDLSHFVC